MTDLYSYEMPRQLKWRVWLVVFAFGLIVNGLVHLALGRPDWVFALRYRRSAGHSGVLVACKAQA